MIQEFRNLFDSNIELLSKETHYSQADILASRKDECCDCRFILIQIAREYSVPDCQIMEFSGFTRQQLQRATEQKDYRMSKLDVKILLQKVRKNTETNINYISQNNLQRPLQVRNGFFVLCGRRKFAIQFQHFKQP